MLMLTEIDRSTHVGGSDVAAILGLSPWASAWSVWAEKVGLTAPDPDNLERLAIGQDAEVFLAAVFARHFPHLHLGGAQAELLHPDYPVLRGHADGFVLESADADVSDAIAGWEAKTSGDFKPWDEVPAYYQCQAQTYMMLTGLPEWRFTVGFARWQVEHYTVEANVADQRLIAAEVYNFWERHVIAGVPPLTDDHRATSDALKAAYPGDETLDAAVADDALMEMVRELDGAKRHVAANRKRVEALENAIKAVLGDRLALVHGDNPKPVVTWKPQTRTDLDAAAVRAEHGDRYDTTATFRVLRLSLPKTDHNTNTKEKAA